MIDPPDDPPPSVDDATWRDASSELVLRKQKSRALLRELRELEDDRAVLAHLRAQLAQLHAVERLDLYTVHGDALHAVGAEPGPTIPIAGSSFEIAITRRQERVWMTLPRPILPGDEAAVDEGMKSSLMVPLVTQGQVVGLMALYASRPFAFQHGDASDLAPICDYTAQLLLWRRLRAAEAELRSAQSALAARDKLAALGRLAAGVAHEINNPSAYVLSNLERVQQLAEAPASGRSPEARKQMAEAAQDGIHGMLRIREIVADLAVFARRGEDSVALVGIHSVVQAAVNMTRGDFRARAHLELELAEVGPVLANATRLTQVVLNLLTNAAQSFAGDEPQRNRVVLRTRREGDDALIEVEDNGPGIPHAARAHMFEPFFSARGDGLGMGMGLAVSRSIVREFAGTLSFSSELGRGTTFVVRLPAGAESSRDLEAPAPKKPPPRSGRLPAEVRVLLLDDEALIRKVLRLQLEDTFAVQEAASAEQAMELVSTAGFDVILCDVHLPGKSGVDFYEHLRAHHPELAGRVVFMSGGSLTGDAERFLAQHKGRSLNKPVEINELRETIERVAHGGSGARAG